MQLSRLVSSRSLLLGYHGADGMSLETRCTTSRHIILSAGRLTRQLIKSRLKKGSFGGKEGAKINFRKREFLVFTERNLKKTTGVAHEFPQLSSVLLTDCFPELLQPHL